MLKRKVILSAVALTIVLLGVICVSIILSFKFQEEKVINEAVPPHYLTADEIAIIESGFGIKLPLSTQKIKVHLNRNGLIYCYVLFEKEDLEEFKSGRLWLSGDDAVEIIKTQTIPPYHSVWSKFYYDIKPVEWWNIDGNRVSLASKDSLYGDSKVDITIESDSYGVHCYLILLIAETKPAEMQKLFSSQPGWDTRESGMPVQLEN